MQKNGGEKKKKRLICRETLNRKYKMQHHFRRVSALPPSLPPFLSLFCCGPVVTFAKTIFCELQDEVLYLTYMYNSLTSRAIYVCTKCVHQFSRGLGYGTIVGRPQNKQRIVLELETQT